MAEDILLSITEASELIGVSVSTLRRWDEVGRFPSIKTEGGHRRYSKHAIDLYLNDLWAVAKDWVLNGTEIPPRFYCRISPVFQARLSKMVILMGREDHLKEIVNLLGNVVGEIGINSFDHNIGNWPDPDTAGIFFAYDMNKREVILADRGRGVLATLKRVKPELVSHEDALMTAFTEVISGREPENRGNGLKYVRKTVGKTQMGLEYRSGDAKAKIYEEKNSPIINQSKINIKGTLVKITF